MNKRIQEFAIEWAKYLDWDFPNDPTEYTFTSDSLSKFAELIAAAEREACAKVCDARYMGDNNREDMEARRCAAAIRARGEQ